MVFQIPLTGHWGRFPIAEQLGRSYSSCAEDNPICLQGEDLSAAFGFHSDGLRSFKQNLPDVNPSPNRKI